MTAYDQLTTRFTRVATLGEASSVLGWDAATMMPPGGGAARGDQLAVLAGLSHSLMSAPELGDDLAAAEAAADAPRDPWRAANLRLMRKAYIRATAMPRDLVEAQARANSACEKIWREARRDADFASVRKKLEEVVRLVREAAAAWAQALGLSPYDALMDGFQHGLRAADVAPVFADYERFLRRALPQAEERQARQPAPLRPQGPFPIEAQEALCRRLSERLGLDFNHARLDRSAHPFSGGTRTDVRITTRYVEADFAPAVLAVVHETGHALYERGLPPAFDRQPVGEAAGMATHESQSLIVEMQACRSDGFLSWLGPELHATFGGDAGAIPGGEPGAAVAARRTRLHPRRRGRDDLSRACHPAVSPGASDGGRRPGGGRFAGRLERRSFRHCSASRRRTMRAAACRTSTGTTARSAISPATRWVRWRRRN